MSNLEASAARIITAHMGVVGGEAVLVVTDEARRRIGLAIHKAARAAGAEAIYVEIIERETNGTEPPFAVAEAMAAADVLIAPTTKSLSHTTARKRASEAGVRSASMPGVTEEVMERALAAELPRLKSLCAAYAGALSAGKTAVLTSPGGSNCRFELGDREGIPDDGDLTAKGAFGNLPAGEAFIAPIERRASGVIVFDGSLSPDGAVVEPVRVFVEDGRAVKVEGHAPGFAALPESYGPLAWEVAELGIGTNEAAAITGNILEDEKVASTVHVAFGNNATIGGVTEVPSHHDGVVRNATLAIDGVDVLKDGKLLLS